MGEEVVEGWLEGAESAKSMLSMVMREQPLSLVLLPPPLDRVPLRLGNVVEIVGPSPSSKTHLLIQAAVSCILPKEWNGVNYGGLGNLVMFFDLDCRFEILRLSQALKHRIMEGTRANPNWEQGDADVFNCNQKKGPHIEFDRELFSSCMRRFLYVRCYDSLEFLSTLKTLHYQLQRERETYGVDVHFLMIDRNSQKWSSENSSDMRTVGNGPKKLPYREYMPSIWQSFVTHRVLVRASDEDSKHHNSPIYLSQWLLPLLSVSDMFIITDAGVSTL